MEIQRIAYLEGVLSTVIDYLTYLLKHEHHPGLFHPDSITAQKHRLEYYNAWLYYFFRLEMLIVFTYFHTKIVIYHENTSRIRHRELDHRPRSR